MDDAEIKELQKKKEELQLKLSDPETTKSPEKIKTLSIEFSKVNEALEKIIKIQELNKKIKDTEELRLSSKNDELNQIAEEEIQFLQKQLVALTAKEKISDEEIEKAIVEIRAGTGGNEASLFAGELLNMYLHYSSSREWKTNMISESKSDLGGIKEAVFENEGVGAYHDLKTESGVHRVQRIPETEKQGRIHTSTASVAVLKEAKEVDVEIRPQDIKIEFFRSSGPGGQNVNKVETAVRIYHIPTGLVITSQESRSQQKNREQAMSFLRTKILDARLQEEAKKIAKERKDQIGSAERSEKIRTYNFPQDRVTDHRIQKSWHNIKRIMEGDISDIIIALKEEIS